MNTRTKANPDTAMNVVGESLGINLEDLGGDRDPDSFITDTDDDLGDGDDDGDDLLTDGRQQQRPQDDNDEEDAGDDDTSIETDSRQQQRPEDRQRPDDLSVTHTKKDEFSVGKFKFDKQGNVVNEAGKILANKGREARLFTTLHKTRGDLNSIQSTARDMIQSQQSRLTKAIEIGTQAIRDLEALKAQGNVGQRAGLNDTELNEAVQFASMYKQDKVGAIKYMLTKAHASGIDLTSLGLQPGGFDTSSLMQLIKQEISQAVQPIQQINQRETDQQRLAREQEEAASQAAETVNQFLFQNPEAKRYLPVIRQILSTPEYANMSLNEIWLNIQLNRLRNPRSRQEQPGGNRQSRSQNRQQPRVPDGRQHLGGAGGNRDQQQPDSQMADVDVSYDDIVKQVLRQVR